MPAPSLREAPRNSRPGAGRRPAVGCSSALSSVGRQNTESAGGALAWLSPELGDPERWRAETPGLRGKKEAGFCRPQKFVPGSGRVFDDYYCRGSMRSAPPYTPPLPNDQLRRGRGHWGSGEHTGEKGRGRGLTESQRIRKDLSPRCSATSPALQAAPEVAGQDQPLRWRLLRGARLRSR